MQSLSEAATDQQLKDMLTKSIGGIGQHTSSLKSILEAQGTLLHGSVRWPLELS